MMNGNACDFLANILGPSLCVGRFVFDDSIWKKKYISQPPPARNLIRNLCTYTYLGTRRHPRCDSCDGTVFFSTAPDCKTCHSFGQLNVSEIRYMCGCGSLTLALMKIKRWWGDRLLQKRSTFMQVLVSVIFSIRRGDSLETHHRMTNWSGTISLMHGEISIMNDGF